MTKREVGALLGLVIVAYSVGYQQGLRSIMNQWSKDVTPSLTSYLAARDVFSEFLEED